MQDLLLQIRNCRECEKFLPHGVNPIIQADQQSKIVIVGQAPGRIVHHTNIPWNDKSGDKLRNWMGVDTSTFYDARKIALMPMGFCYPGKNKTGDLPPRKECAPLWHQQLFNRMPNVKLILLVGQYAQNHYLGKQSNRNLSETVRDYKLFLPQYFPLPHPSPRNNIWLAKNNWFLNEVIPVLKTKIYKLLH